MTSIPINNKYPLPLINPSYESLCNAKIPTKLDLHNAYLHNACSHQRRGNWNAAFNIPLGHSEYYVLQSPETSGEQVACETRKI